MNSRLQLSEKTLFGQKMKRKPRKKLLPKYQRLKSKRRKKKVVMKKHLKKRNLGKKRRRKMKMMRVRRVKHHQNLQMMIQILVIFQGSK